MRFLKTIFLTTCLLLSVTISATVKGRVSLPAAVRPETLTTPFSNMKLILDSQQYAYTKYDNSFELRNVADGVHHLEVYHPHYIFPTYRLTVSNDGRSLRATSVDPGIPPQESMSPSEILLTTVGGYKYFKPRPSMSVLSMLMNPMVLMMGVSLLLMVAMPKLTENLDPEELKRMQEEQKKTQQDMQDPSKLMAQLLGTRGADEKDSDSDSD